MEKKLVVVGNSLALVIDKPIRAVLGLTRDTPVEVTFDGRRLIIERAEAPATDTTFETLDRWAVLNVLREQFGLASEQFARLHHDPGCRLMAFVAKLDPMLGRELPPEDEVRAGTRRSRRRSSGFQRQLRRWWRPDHALEIQAPR